MKKYVIIGLIISAGCCLPVPQAYAQDTLRTPYFPYQKGDILVYSVYDFDRNYLKDIKLEITVDSVGQDGRRYVQSFLYEQQYSTDSLGNIYSNYFYEVENSMLFAQKALVNDPWIRERQKQDEMIVYELANKKNIEVVTSFGKDDTITFVEYYSNPDSSETSGLQRAELTWSYRFGLTRTYDYEGGNRNVLKGAVLDGEVYGDTTVYTPPTPSEVQKDYFPYKHGDVLLFSVNDSMGNQQWDSKITFKQDSVDASGSVWYSVKSEGSDPFIHQFRVDTSRNVYGTGWWKDNQDPWMIYYAYNEQSIPWIAFNKGEYYELGMVMGIETRSVFGRNFGMSNIYNVFTINYYLAEDSTTQGFDTYEGGFRAYAEWTKEFGIFHKYEYDTGLTYDLKGGILDGVVFGDTTTVITSNEPVSTYSSRFVLHQNYPNPFNPSTNIRFTLPEKSQVSLVVYDMLGREVATLVNEMLPAGEKDLRFDASNLANGIYLYKLRAGNEEISRKMTLIK